MIVCDKCRLSAGRCEGRLVGHRFLRIVDDNCCGVSGLYDGFAARVVLHGTCRQCDGPYDCAYQKLCFIHNVADLLNNDFLVVMDIQTLSGIANGLSLQVVVASGCILLVNSCDADACDAAST